MGEAKPTPGPCYADGQVVHSDAVTCIAKFGDAYPDRRWSGTDFATEAHKEANAELFADALNVLTDTGLTPSQLVERVKEMEEALDSITSMCEVHGDFSNGVTDPTGAIDEGNVVAGRIIGDARAALSRARPNTAGWEANTDSVREDAALVFTTAHIDYVARFGGRCRDCADESGVCPGSGLPCTDSRKAIKHVFDALEYGVKHGYIKSPIASRKQAAAKEPSP